ncbi:MAG: hypothetical protein KatS3mg065_1110 [Chloroflexota bacterium]|nr:MAG: hypothetical protein KatS3mg065_1110 [Chloroflexota bacterium]
MPAVIRTQISLTGAQMARLRAEAKRRGVSMAVYRPGRATSPPVTTSPAGDGRW